MVQQLTGCRIQSVLLTIRPRDGNALKEDEEEKTHAAGRVLVEEREDIHTALSQQIRVLLWCLYYLEQQQQVFAGLLRT